MHEEYGKFAGGVGKNGDDGWVERIEVWLGGSECFQWSDYEVEGVIDLAEGVGF